MSNPNISALISAAETRESNVTAVIELLSELPQPERVEVLVAALLRTSRVAVGISFGPPMAVSPVATTLSPVPGRNPLPASFADEPVAVPAPRLQPPPTESSGVPRNPSKARPTSRKGSGQEATRILPQEDVGRLVELVEKHPGSSSPWLAKQLDVNPAGLRWRNTLQAALETGALRKEGKDNKTRYFRGYFRGNDAGPG